MTTTRIDPTSNINYNDLFYFIKQHKSVVIQGPEGYQKTFMILDILSKESVNKDEMTIISCKSYEQLKEKQQNLITYFGLTEKQCPIISRNNDEKYLSYLTTPTEPDLIFEETKFILVTQASVQKCHHCARYYYKKDGRRITKSIVNIFVDEFDCDMGIVPSLSYAWENYSRQNYFTSPHLLNKKAFWNFLETNYSSFDRNKARFCEKHDWEKFFVAHWIEDAQDRKAKVIIATAELLPVKLLEAIEFSVFNLNWKKEEEVLKSHEIFTHSSPNIISNLFERLNTQNKWGIFGFQTIVSDQYVPLEGMISEIKVINHMKSRGTNSLIGQYILTIISHIPDFAIQQITDCINSFYSHEEVDFETVKTLFYRDRLCQAVGRVIGYRGIYGNITKTHLLIHSSIMDRLEKKINDKDLMFYYTIKSWDNILTNEEFLRIDSQLAEDKRIKRDEQKVSYSKKKDKNMDQLNQQIDLVFEQDSESIVTDEQIKEVIEKNQIADYRGKLVRPRIIINYFEAKIKKTSCTMGKNEHGGYIVKNYLKITGIKIK